MTQTLLMPSALVRSGPGGLEQPDLDAMSTRRVLVMASDELRGRALARALRLLCDVEFQIIDTTTLAKPAPEIVVTMGVAPSSASAIRTLRIALRPFLSRAIPVLCLLDAPTLRDEVQARAIGASMVLATDSPSRLIAGAIRSLASPMRPHRGAESHSVQAGVQSVGFVLADLMNAASSGLCVDSQLSEQAGQFLIEALEQDGIGHWMAAVRSIHDQTYRHCLLTAGIMASFALQLGFPSADCRRLVRGAVLHDIGKALIPVEIIDKTGPLTAQEVATVRNHAAYGHELLVAQDGHHPQVLDIVRHHHEYLDGSGYPDRLRGAQITDAVRIATISDVFAALVERRSYKPSLSCSEAFVLLEEMGGKLDTDLVRAFRRLFAPV